MSENYFKILNVPEKLLIDHNELKKNYFNLLKQHSNDPILDPEKNKKDNIKKKDLIEAAYQTLKDRITRIEHLLEIQGIEVANDNKVPTQLADLFSKVEELLIQAKNDRSLLSELKKVHTSVLTEFSSASIELARLEQAWDQGDSDNSDTLKKLRRKSALFSSIRSLEQNLRVAISESA